MINNNLIRLLLLICTIYARNQLAAASWYSLGEDVESESLRAFRVKLEEPVPEPIIPPTATPEEIEFFKKWQASPYYLPTYDPDVIAIPKGHLAFQQEQAVISTKLYQDILADSIENYQSLLPSGRLMLRWSFKFLSSFVTMRMKEKKIEPRLEPKKEYFGLAADLIEVVINESAKIKQQKGYTKRNVDVQKFYKYAREGWEYLRKTLLASPVGTYLRFDQVRLFMDDKTHPKHGQKIIPFVADQLAQWRAIGYDQTMFVAKKLVSIMRVFSTGMIPEPKSYI